MDTFRNRIFEHDKIAIPYLKEEFEKHGLVCIKHGVEIHDERLQKSLMLLGRTNQGALRDRYKPDFYIIPNGNEIVQPFMCEVKSESRGHKNYAIEWDSFCSAKIWDNGQKAVMYAFIEIVNEKPVSLVCCWIDEIKISYVNVPMRFDFERNMTELTELYPDIEFKPSEHKAGAGTPFFIIPKKASYLRSIDKFLYPTIPDGHNDKIDKSTQQLSLF